MRLLNDFLDGIRYLNLQQVFDCITEDKKNEFINQLPDYAKEKYLSGGVFHHENLRPSKKNIMEFGQKILSFSSVEFINAELSFNEGILYYDYKGKNVKNLIPRVLIGKLTPEAVSERLNKIDREKLKNLKDINKTLKVDVIKENGSWKIKNPESVMLDAFNLKEIEKFLG